MEIKSQIVYINRYANYKIAYFWQKQLTEYHAITDNMAEKG